MGIQHVSSTGIGLIKSFEGCRLTAYLCPAGVWTIGYGHTAGVKSGQTITQAQAEEFLRTDLEKYEAPVRKYDSKYHWNQNQFDALVSFTYNCGAGNLNKLVSNGLRSIQEIANHILDYNKSKGKVLAGLVRRRAAEKELFLKECPSASITVPSTSISAKAEPAKSKDISLAGTYEVTASELRLRLGAGTDKSIIVNMPKGAKVICYGYFTNVSGVPWLYVTYGSKTGYASSKYLRKQ